MNKNIIHSENRPNLKRARIFDNKSKEKSPIDKAGNNPVKLSVNKARGSNSCLNLHLPNIKNNKN